MCSCIVVRCNQHNALISCLQVVVICGRNDALRRKLSSGAFNKGATKVHAFGFVKNMHEFMNASDAIITKAGARPPVS